jgi:hypothetical protein
MPRPWFNAEPVDDSFFGTAPSRLSDTFAISRPASEVWAELTADDTLSWCRILSSVEWTSSRPFGVGTTRTVRSLGGTSVLRERYFVWEEGRRQAFYVVQASAPLFRRFAEDYVVEPVSDSSCRFTWTIAYEPRPAARLSDPINRRLLGSLFKDTRKHYRAS